MGACSIFKTPFCANLLRLDAFIFAGEMVVLQMQAARVGLAPTQNSRNMCSAWSGTNTSITCITPYGLNVKRTQNEESEAGMHACLNECGDRPFIHFRPRVRAYECGVLRLDVKKHAGMWSKRAPRCEVFVCVFACLFV
jgi:hypothetical protein